MDDSHDMKNLQEVKNKIDGSQLLKCRLWGNADFSVGEAR